jgi:hypothetical protein
VFLGERRAARPGLVRWARGKSENKQRLLWSSQGAAAAGRLGRSLPETRLKERVAQARLAPLSTPKTTHGASFEPPEDTEQGLARRNGV